MFRKLRRPASAGGRWTINDPRNDHKTFARVFVILLRRASARGCRSAQAALPRSQAAQRRSQVVSREAALPRSQAAPPRSQVVSRWRWRFRGAAGLANHLRRLSQQQAWSSLHMIRPAIAPSSKESSRTTMHTCSGMGSVPCVQKGCGAVRDVQCVRQLTSARGVHFGARRPYGSASIALSSLVRARR